MRQHFYGRDECYWKCIFLTSEYFKFIKMDLMKGLLVVVIVSAVITPSQARSIQQRSTCEAPQPPTCDNRCDDISYYHSKQTDTCVECILCPPGQQPEHNYDPCGAQAEGREVRCVPCQSQQFSTGNDQDYCKPCRLCIGRVATTECSATTDRVCGGCKPGYGDDGYGDCYPCSYLSPERQRNTKTCFASTTQAPRSTTPTSKICEVPQPPDCSNSCDDKIYYHSMQSDTCEECLSCPPGEEPTHYDPCEAQARGEEVTCTPCKDGSFSDRHDQSRCKPCTLCDGIISRVTTTECSASTNRVCGGCKLGYYNSYDDCIPCSFLSAERQKTHATCLESTTPAIKTATVSQTKSTTTSQMKSTTITQMKTTTGTQKKTTTTNSQINPTTKGLTYSALGRKVTTSSTRDSHSTSKPKEIVSHQRHGARQDSSEIIFRLALIGGGILAFALIVYCMVYCMRNERKKLQYSTCSTGYTRTSTSPSDDRDDSTAESRNQLPANLQNQENSRSQPIPTAPTNGTRQQDDPEIVANLTRAYPSKNSFNKEVVHQSRTEPQTCPRGGDTTTVGPLTFSNDPSPLKSTENIPRPGRSMSMPQISITPNQLNELTNHSFLNSELQRISDASSGEESDNGTANFPEEGKALLREKETDHSSHSLKVPSTKKLSRRRSSSGGLKSNGGVFSSGSTKGNFALDSAPPSTTSMNNAQAQSPSIQVLTSHPSRTRRKSLDFKRQSSFDNPLLIRDHSPNNEPNERDALIQGRDNSQKSPVAQPQQPGEGVPAFVSYQPLHEQYGERFESHGTKYARQHDSPSSSNPRKYQRPTPRATVSSDSIHHNSDLFSTMPNLNMPSSSIPATNGLSSSSNRSDSNRRSQSPAAVQQIVYNGPVIQAGNINNLQLDLGNNNNLVQQGGTAARPHDVPPTPESVECTDSAIFPIPEEEAKCVV